MKKLVLPALMVTALLLQSFGTSAPEKPGVEPVSLGEVVYAVQLRKEVPTEDLQRDWHFEYLDPFANDSLFAPLFQLVRDKQIDVRIPVYPFTEKMDRDSAVRTISVPYTMKVENFITFEVETVQGIETKRPDEVVAIIFHEEWFYDAVSLVLEKRVKGIIPVVDYGLYSNDESYERRIKPAFYVPIASGEIKSADFTIRNITHNFKTDSVRLADYPLDNKYIMRMSYKSPDISAVNTNLLTSLKQQSKISANKIYEGRYPHAIITDKKKRTAIQNQLDSTDQLRFRESWSCDWKNAAFKKIVHGVFMAKDLGMRENEYSIAESGKSIVYAYLPLNKEPVVFAPMGKVHIENYYMHASAVPVPDANYPMFSAKDSAAIIDLTIQVGTRARYNEMPVFLFWELWEYNNPLDERRKKISPSELENMYMDTVSVYVEDPVNGDFSEQQIVFDKGHDQYGGVGFCESWNYEPATGEFNKVIKTVGILEFNAAAWADYALPKPWLFYDNPTNPIDSVFQPKYRIAQNVVTPCLVNFGEYFQDENDASVPVALYAWTFERNIQNELRFQMVQQVLDLVLAGKLVAWTTDANPKPFTAPQFRAMIDSTAKEGSFHPIRGCEYYLFNEIRCVEDWYYNPRSGQFYKQVTALTFAHRYYDFNRELLFGERRPVPSGSFTIKVNSTK